MGLSIHLRAISSTAFLRARARYLTGGLVAILLTSAYVLVPDQSNDALGSELIVSVVGFWILLLVPVLRLVRAGAAGMSWDVRVRFVLGAVASLLWIACGSA